MSLLPLHLHVINASRQIPRPAGENAGLRDDADTIAWTFVKTRFAGIPHDKTLLRLTDFLPLFAVKRVPISVRKIPGSTGIGSWEKPVRS